MWTLFLPVLISTAFALDHSVLSRTYSIPTTCKLTQKDSWFVEFWCDGKLGWRLEDRNRDGLVDIEEIYRPDGHSIRLDRNHDKKFEFEKIVRYHGTNASYTVAENNRKRSGSYPLLQRNSCDSEQGPLVTLENQLSSCAIPEKNTFIATNCPKDLSRALKEGLDKGMSCLAGRKTPQADSFRFRLQSLIENSKEPVTIDCVDKLQSTSEGGVAEATLPGMVGYPKIYVKINQASAPYIGASLFHEYMHLLGLDHPHTSGDTEAIDPVIMCHSCCFPEFDSGYLEPRAPMFAESKEMACQYCDGTQERIDLYQVFMKNFGVEDMRAVYGAPRLSSGGNRKVINLGPCSRIRRAYPGFNSVSIQKKSLSQIDELYPDIFQQTWNLSELSNCR